MNQNNSSETVSQDTNCQEHILSVLSQI